MERRQHLEIIPLPLIPLPNFLGEATSDFVFSAELRKESRGGRREKTLPKMKSF
jgi:hypothetical protein